MTASNPPQAVLPAVHTRLGPGGRNAQALDVHEPAKAAFMDPPHDLDVHRIGGHLVIDQVA